MLHPFFSTNPRSIFLVDGVGALVSTVLLLTVAYFEPFFGMPKDILYRLVSVTVVFMFYSLGMYFLRPIKWRKYLITIALCNLLYCCLTLVFVFYFFNQLTPWGIAYFFSEMMIIIFLSSIEIRLTKKLGKLS